MEKSWDISSLFDDEVGTPVGFRQKQMKVSIEIPQREKVVFKGWDMGLRRQIMRDIPLGAVFKVVAVSQDGHYIRGVNINYSLRDIVFHKTEVEFTRVPVELHGVDL